MLYCLSEPFSRMLKRLAKVDVQLVEVMDEGLHELNEKRVAKLNEIAKAKELIKSAQSMIKGAQTHLKKLSLIPVLNLVHDAEGELAEAALLLAFRNKEVLPSPEKIGVKEIGYLQGLGDFVGELRRYSIDSLTNDDISEVKRAFLQMEQVYAVLKTFDFPRGLTPGVRKKTDIARGIIERTRADLSTAIENRRLLAGIASLRGHLGD